MRKMIQGLAMVSLCPNSSFSISFWFRYHTGRSCFASIEPVCRDRTVLFSSKGCGMTSIAEPLVTPVIGVRLRYRSKWEICSDLEKIGANDFMVFIC